MTDLVKDHPLLVWAEHDRQTYLMELIRLEGRCGSSDICPGCKTEAARFHCEDCFDVDMYCQNCTIFFGFDVFCKEWSGSYFERRTLKDCGLRIQLGHHIGDKCCRPRPAVKDEFIVLHSNGVHVVSVDFCGCDVGN
ncbi:hypothetical protein BDN67DRAFT_915996 [Paxillus ammoniavirescens]|nr:hypothetical protein BDN67DRAFT_915996 [Paxillus ammoniavirescens]